MSRLRAFAWGVATGVVGLAAGGLVLVLLDERDQHRHGLAGIRVERVEPNL